MNLGLFAARGQQNVSALAAKGEYQKALQASMNYMKFLEDNFVAAKDEDQKKIQKFKEKNQQI